MKETYKKKKKITKLCTSGDKIFFFVSSLVPCSRDKYKTLRQIFMLSREIASKRTVVTRERNRVNRVNRVAGRPYRACKYVIITVYCRFIYIRPERDDGSGVRNNLYIYLQRGGFRRRRRLPIHLLLRAPNKRTTT